jgi:hypothetical protein
LLIRFTCFAHARESLLLGLGHPSVLHDVLDQRRQVERTRDPESPGERPPPLREVEAGLLAVHRSTSTRQPATRVGHDPGSGRAVFHHDA